MLFNIIQIIKGRNNKLNFSKRIFITMSMQLLRATIRVMSHTLPIWSTWRPWKLLVHPLAIMVLPSWWWTWRVEGLLLLLFLLLIVVILTSLLGKPGLIGLINRWQSSFQGINLINGCSIGAFHPLKSCVGGLLVLHE
jgi:hypothetical protein